MTRCTRPAFFHRARLGLPLLAALAAAGFQVGQLTLVFGALGVGIGFGLQDIVRNFVAGMIMMFERPIQRGDTVEVAGMVGQVRGFHAAAFSFFFFATKLENWSKPEKQTRSR